MTAMKRLIDIAASTVGIVFLSPLLLVAAALVRLSSPGPVLFRQVRIGRGFRPFTILKFRTMVVDAPKLGAAITCGDDPRITAIGRFLRKTKLDELPQLFNVLRGDMSLVGPRPEVPRYVEMFREDFAEILAVRPGITDLASITYRNESEILGRARDPQAEYVERILPDKIRLAKEYRRRSSVLFDLRLIVRTIAAIASPETTREPRPS
jgi:lipopolysaccharide/colanic/teichoic acid biosynthesis glycosyltransferase